MARNPTDPERFAEAQYRGRTLYRTPEGWPKPEASFSAEVQQRILNATRVQLCVPDHKLQEFWQLAKVYCLVFARDFQADLAPHPTAVEVRAARAAAERLIAAMRPILGQDPVRTVPGQVPDYFKVKFLKDLVDLIAHLDDDFKPRNNRTRRTAGRIFIPKMMKLFTVSFKQAASEAPDGPFAGFVLACLSKTDGLPETVSGEWVQQRVRECKKQRGAAG